MATRTKKLQAGTFFFVSSFDDYGISATPMDPVSAAQAKRCDDCGERKGVLFLDRGQWWKLEEKITRFASSRCTRCNNCMMENLEPVYFHKARSGELMNTGRHILMFAKDEADLLLQVKLWNSGQKLIKPVRTKYGEVAVFAKQKSPDWDDYVMRCPHCKKGIALTVAPDNDSV
jgi:hypothetical protein